MDVAGSAADVALVSADLGCGALGSGCAEIDPVNDEVGYVHALVGASLRLVRNGLPLVVRHHGVRMLQHLLNFRKGELSSTEIASLREVLAVSLDGLVLKGPTTALDDPVGSAANLMENNKHRQSLLVLATENNSRSLAAMETNTVIGKVTGEEKHCGLQFDNLSSSEISCDGCSSISNELYCSSSSEEYDYFPFMTNRVNIGDTGNIIEACKEFVEFADPRKLVNGEMMPRHQGKGSVLLVEHNIICQAFLIVISYSGTHQYKEILPCLLSPLNKIWTFPEWKSKYLLHGFGLTCLLSDSQFVKMVYYVVRICEEQLKRSRTEVFPSSKSSDLYIVTILQRILPLLLQLLECIHGLWDPTIACNLSEELQRAKHPDPFFPFECNTKLAHIKKEGSQEKEAQALLETRALLEGIRESGYNVIGLCASIEDAFSNLLNSLSVSVALAKNLGSLEFRHLRKLIQLTIIPVIKNCPCKFWKEWVDNLLQPLLRHTEEILHSAWFSLLYHGRAGVPFYYGKLPGLEEKVKTAERDILVEFTREVAGLLEVLALIEQNRALPPEYVTRDNRTISFQDIDFMPSPSLFRYLVSSDCFGRLRMGLFGYFVDDKATAKAIPFCRSLVRLAVASNDARLRIFILDNLLPCLIQHLDNELPCAILRLKCKLKSSASDSASANDNAGRDLVVLCQDLYGYLLNSGYVLTQALAGEDKNNADAESSFQVWLERQKKDFRLKAYSAAKELPNGYLWKWEFEDEFQRYLSAYIDMLQEVDAMDDCAENIYMDKESLFRKLRPEFRSKYAINSCVHPYMVTISSIRQRKVYSMTAVVRNRKICNFLRKLIELKPYIKVSDRSCDVISRLKQAFEIPAELSKCDVAPSVELLLRSVLFFWEPRYHPMIRQAHKDKLLGVVDRLTARESLKPVMPIIRDFPLHLQPYAQAFVETKLKESKYFIAKEQIRLHEEFDKYLASREMDLYMDQLTSSKVDFVEDLVANKLLPSQFLVLERFLMELSFERRAEIVQMQTEIDTYSECLCGLFKNELLKRRVKSSISELEAEGFFDVDSNCVNWGKPSFSELIDRFHHEVFCRHSLPKHHAIRGLIDCRAIFLREDIDCQEAVKKVVVDVCNELTGYLPKFWEDTRYYEHQYYAIIRDPLKQVILAPCTN